MWKVHTQDPRGNTEGTRTLKRKVKAYSNLTTDQKVGGSNPSGRTDDKAGLVLKTLIRLLL